VVDAAVPVHSIKTNGEGALVVEMPATAAAAAIIPSGCSIFTGTKAKARKPGFHKPVTGC